VLDTRQRWGGILGIVSAVLFFFGVTMPNLPDWKVTTKHPNPAQHVASFYNSSGNRARLVIAAYLLALSGLAFLWFLSTLRERVRRAGVGSGVLTDVATGAGLLFVAMMFAAGACWATIAGNIIFGNQLHPNPELAAFLPQLGYPLLLIFGMLSAAVMVALVSVQALQTGALPRWLAYAGFVVSVALLVAVFFIPMILFLLWILAVSIVVLRSGAVPATQVPA